MAQYDVTVENNGKVYDLLLEGDREPTDAEVMSAFQASEAQPAVAETQNAQMGPSEVPGVLDLAKGALRSLRESGPVTAFLGPTRDQELAREALAGSVDERNAIEREGLIQSAARTIKDIAFSSPIPEIQVPQGEGVGGQIGGALLQTGADVARGLASPLGAATGGLATQGARFLPAGVRATARVAGLTPRVAQVGIASAFAPQAWEAAKSAALMVADNNGTLQEQLTAGLEAGLAIFGTVAPLAGIPGESAQSLSPRMAPSAAIAAEGEAAAGRLARRLRIDTPLSAGQTTGAAGISKFEAFSRRIGSGLSAEMLGIEAQQMAVSDAVSQLVASASSASPDVVGRQVIGEMVSKERGAARGAAQAAGQGARAVEVAAERNLQSATGLTPQELTKVGSDVRKSLATNVEMNRNAASTKFQDAENALKGVPPNFVTLPSTRNIVQTIFRSAAKDNQGEVVRPFLKAYGTLQQLENMPAQTLTAAQRTKSIIGEAIGRMEDGAMDTFGAGFNLGDLKRIYGALATDIDRSIERVGSTVARDKFRSAVTFYRDNIEALEQSPAVRRVLNQASDGGIANTADIVRYFAQGAGRIDDLKAIKGLVTPGTYNQLRRGILDSLKGNSVIPTASGGVVDLSRMRSQFQALDTEFKRELMGSDANARVLQSTLDRFDTAEKALSSSGMTSVASPEQITALMDSIQTGNSKAGVADFNRSVSAEQTRRKLYHNDLTKRITDGTLGDVIVEPARLVDEVFLASERPELVREGMRQLSPDLQREVQVLAAKTLLQQAMDVESSTLARIIGGETNLKSERIVNLMVENPKKRAVLNLLIPDDLKPVIEDFVAYRRAIDQSYKQGGGQGLVAATEQFTGAHGRGGPLEAPARWLNSMSRLFINRKLADFTFSPAGVKTLKFLAQPGNSVVNLAARGIRGLAPSISAEGIGYLSAVYGGEMVEKYLQDEERLRVELEASIQAGEKIDSEALNIMTGIPVGQVPQPSATPTTEAEPTPAPQPPPVAPAPKTKSDRRQRIEAARTKLKGTRERMTQ